MLTNMALHVESIHQELTRLEELRLPPQRVGVEETGTIIDYPSWGCVITVHDK